MAGHPSSQRRLLTVVMATDYLAPGFFVAVGLVGLVVVAAFIPARRAARVNPMVALRYE